MENVEAQENSKNSILKFTASVKCKSAYDSGSDRSDFQAKILSSTERLASKGRVCS